jgi:hypothetical protein
MLINFEDIELKDHIRATYYEGEVYVTREGLVTLITSRAAYASGNIVAVPGNTCYLVRRDYV